MKYTNIHQDIRSLGSWILFVLVFARASIEWYRPFVDQMIIAGVLLIIISYILNFDGYVARSLTVAVFTSLFYQDIFFSIFISIVTLLIWYSSTKFTSKIQILKGIVVGVFVTAIGLGIPYLY